MESGDNVILFSLPGSGINRNKSWMLKSISKKHFCPGGMAASEWTRSVRAVRKTAAVDFSTPGINTAHRVAYRPRITVLPIVLALLVGLLFETNTLALGPTVTIRRNGFIGYTLSSGMQWVMLSKSLLAFLLH
jgi:hypothetical protein